MSRRGKLSLPMHIRLTMNLKIGLYEVIEPGILYQLTFAQMNDLKLYCRANHGSMISTLASWYCNLSSFCRKFVGRTGTESGDTGFFPDE